MTVPKTPDIENNDVTQDLSSWFSAPSDNGDSVGDSSIKKLDDAQPAE